ncbi:zinc finger, CCHC domain containing 10 [Reticulomyxa filosa]|uniref:Zinc finger, CCHC domain containing 10 n=1 Tax=Reticulomyxa filosa TaxID=46433 RepID=X6M3Y3_RETFI|nr:zinc finger, CCHC domain containing 10 [Reticulomyxa filosa]|eukprot:ETO08639.1 zinc finger, CCHC domain containing 10 [Reticulomyxa filosa]
MFEGQIRVGSVNEVSVEKKQDNEMDEKQSNDIENIKCYRQSRITTHCRLVSTNINTDNRPRPSDIAKDDDKPKTKGKEIQESDNDEDRNSSESLQSNTSSSSVSSAGFEDMRSGLQMRQLNKTSRQNPYIKKKINPNRK